MVSLQPLVERHCGMTHTITTFYTRCGVSLSLDVMASSAPKSLVAPLLSIHQLTASPPLTLIILLDVRTQASADDRDHQHHLWRSLRNRTLQK